MSSREFVLPDVMFFPRFLISPKGISPDISLPRDYKTLVPLFEASKGIDKLNIYASEVENLVSKEALGLVSLGWDEKNKGLLKYIRFGVHGSLNLEEENHIARYANHNFEYINGLWAATIAINYVRELIQ